MTDPTIAIAFLAGIISFLSPCILPIIPGFLAYLSGSSDKDESPRKKRVKTFLNSVFFVLGFSLVFAALGVLLNTVLERISYDVQIWLSRVGGVIIILFALNILKLVKIPFLERDHKIAVKRKFSVQYITSFLFGAAFAAGWTPCVGAILGSVFALAVTKPGFGFILLMSYALGLGIPFLLVGLFTEQAIALISRSENFLKYFNIVVGILLLLLGILVFTGKLVLVSNFFAAPLLLGL